MVYIVTTVLEMGVCNFPSTGREDNIIMYLKGVNRGTGMVWLKGGWNDLAQGGLEWSGSRGTGVVWLKRDRWREFLD